MHSIAYFQLHLIVINPHLPRSGSSNSSVVEHQVSDRKIADPLFDSQIDHVSLGSWEKDATLISYWGPAVYPLWCRLRLMKDFQTEPKTCLRWCG